MSWKKAASFDEKEHRRSKKDIALMEDCQDQQVGSANRKKCYLPQWSLAREFLPYSLSIYPFILFCHLLVPFSRRDTGAV
jgi:hypothetical protein